MKCRFIAFRKGEPFKFISQIAGKSGKNLCNIYKMKGVVQRIVAGVYNGFKMYGSIINRLDLHYNKTGGHAGVSLASAASNRLGRKAYRSNYV